MGKGLLCCILIFGVLGCGKVQSASMGSNSSGSTVTGDEGNSGGSGNVYGNVTTLAGKKDWHSFNAIGTAATFNGPLGVVADGSGNLYIADTQNQLIRKIVIASGVVTTLAGNGAIGSTDGIGTAASFNYPSGMATDGSGNLYVADRFNHLIRKIVISSGLVTTFAGSGSSGSADGTGVGASFNNPFGIAADGSGNLYVADSSNQLIRQIVIASGLVTTLAGSGSFGFTDGIGSGASFRNPFGVTVDGSGNLYVADAANHAIRQIVIASGLVTTLAGSGSFGFTDGIGSGASFNSPSSVTADGSGNLYVADTSNHAIRQVVISSGAVTTLAGSGSSGSADAAGSGASFNYPYAVAGDGSGNLYVADTSNDLVRKVIITNGAVSTFAGDRLAGFRNGTGTGASFQYPSGAVSDTSGNLYVADRYNHAIRKIVIASGVVTTLAGSGSSGSSDGTGSGASFNYPYAVAIDTSGNLYVADTYNHVIRKVVIASGLVTTLAGSGSSGSSDGTGSGASFNYPSGVAVDTSGNLYVADTSNHLIRKIVISSGLVTTLAGSGSSGFTDGTGVGASFNRPSGVALDAAGNLYVADTSNHVIRKIVISSGLVMTLAGSGSSGSSDGTGSGASFNNPSGVAVDTSGNLYVADTSNHVIRKIVISSGLVTTLAGSGSSGSTDAIGTGASFQGPYGVAVDTSGHLYVADTQNHVIRTCYILGN